MISRIMWHLKNLSNDIVVDKNSSHSVIIEDIVMNVVPVCSEYQVPSYKPNFDFASVTLNKVGWFEHAIYSRAGAVQASSRNK